ncbi:MAG: prepilin-type N-terminal cleavage/methylation domain-containing protein, partial [Acidimicrobiales bacterium]
MLSIIKQRLGKDEDEGFTLIELMVVVLIIAILLAIAIPTFLGARNTANARAAQSDLRNALTAEQTYWTNNQTFDATVADMNGIEPNLTWTTAAPTSASIPNTVAVYLATSSAAGDTVDLQAYAKDGNCYTVEQSNDPTLTGNTVGYAVNKGNCTAASNAQAFVAPVSG